MAKAEWGMKRICPHCGTRFYDMKKKPPTCPSCGTVIDLDAIAKTRRSRPVPDDKARKVAAVPEDLDDLPAIADDDADVIIEDVDELGEDEVDVDADAVADVKKGDGVD